MKTLTKIKKIIFCDYDGVLTDKDTSWFNAAVGKYQMSDKCARQLENLLKLENARIVISSNWRKFIDMPALCYKEIKIHNPLPAFYERFNDKIIGITSADKQLSKLEALKLWLENNSENASCSFVIFDDDLNEGFQDDPILSKHFVKTDPKFGLTSIDIVNARKILNPEL